MSDLNFDIQPPSSVDIRALRLRLNGDLVAPRRSRLGRRPPRPGTSRSTSSPSRSRSSSPLPTSSPSSSSRASTACASRRRAPATAPRRSATSRTRSSSRPSACAESRSTPTRAARASRPARSGPDVVEPAAAAGLRRAARLLARRRRRRLHARRRHGLARPQPRPRGQQRHGGRARHRRRRARPRRPRQRARPLLGRPRRRRQLRHRDRDRARAATRLPSCTPAPCSGRSSAPREVLHAWREWVETVPDEVTSLGRILHFPPLAGHPGAASRRAASSSSRPSSPAPRREGAALLAPLRALGPAIDTFAAVPPTALDAPAHGSAASGARRRRRDVPRRAAGRGRRRDRRDRRAAAALARDPAPRRRLATPLGARTVPSARSTPRFAMFAVGFAPTPEIGAAVEQAVDRAKARTRAVGVGAHLLQLLRAPRRRRPALPDRDVPPAPPDQDRVRRRRAVRRQPSDPAGTLVAVSGAAAPRMRRSRPASLVSVARRVLPCATSGRRREAHRDARAGRLHPRGPARSGSVRASARPAVRADEELLPPRRLVVVVGGYLTARPSFSRARAYRGVKPRTVVILCTSERARRTGRTRLRRARPSGGRAGPGSRSHEYQPQLSDLVRFELLGLAADPLHLHPVRPPRSPLGNVSTVSATTCGTAPTSPVSSSSSRRAVSSSVSPGSALPPGRRPGTAPVRRRPPAEQHLPVAHDEHADPGSSAELTRLCGRCCRSGPG